MNSWGVLIVLFCLHQSLNARSVWIDTDVSIGSPIREVDDAYALVLAFHSPEIRIAGISTSFGNAPLGHTHRTALDLVRRFGGQGHLNAGDVFEGAVKPRDWERRTRASEALAANLRERPLTYIALGPLTNLAAFLELHPTMAGRIERVIMLGGQTPGSTLALGSRRSFHIHDANVFKDPAAVAIVLRSKIPIVLVPIETAAQLIIDGQDMRRLERGGPAGSYLARRSRIWLWFWTSIVNEKGGAIFDAVAMMAAVKPQLLVTERRYAAMDEKGNLRVMGRKRERRRPVIYVTGFAPETKRVVMRRIMAQW